MLGPLLRYELSSCRKPFSSSPFPLHSVFAAIKSHETVRFYDDFGRIRTSCRRRNSYWPCVSINLHGQTHSLQQLYVHLYTSFFIFYSGCVWTDRITSLELSSSRFCGRKSVFLAVEVEKWKLSTLKSRHVVTSDLIFDKAIYSSYEADGNKRAQPS